ncbi:MAG TPA: hypothetical protein VF291_08790 [Burkholderiaceae bacterium]
MDLPAMTRRLMRLLRGESPSAGTVDAADLGTAFGLDASLLDSQQLDEDDLLPWRTPSTPPAVR